jgi:hypothetical protein
VNRNTMLIVGAGILAYLFWKQSQPAAVVAGAIPPNVNVAPPPTAANNYNNMFGPPLQGSSVVVTPFSTLLNQVSGPSVAVAPIPTIADYMGTSDGITLF